MIVLAVLAWTMDFYAFVRSLSLKLKIADNRYTYQYSISKTVEIYAYQLGRFLIIIKKKIVINVTMIRRKSEEKTHVKLVTILNGRYKFLL